MKEHRSNKEQNMTSRSLQGLAVLALLTLPQTAFAQGSMEPGTCPNWELNGQIQSLTTDDLQNGTTFPVVAGGPVPLHECMTVPGIGFVGLPPDFTMLIRGDMKDQDLVFTTQGDCDTTLLINDSRTEWHFDDDGAGNLQAKITLENPSEGVYDIWIGTISPELCQASVNLILQRGGI